MAGIIGLITDVFEMSLATVGAVDVTLGLVTAGALVFGLGISVVKRIKGR